MSNYRVIGVGAAGNKGAIELIESGVFGKEDVLLLNTTMRDIDPKYRGIAKQIGSSMSGSGKERKLAYQLTVKELSDGNMDYIDELLKAKDIYACIIIAAVGGGSGSGASIAIANYVASIGVPVHICGYIGFSTDSRELQNTLGFAKSIVSDFGVEFICNSKFLEAANNNVKKAEVLSNKELATRMQIYTGQPLRDSAQNIDDTELYKINSTAGFTSIEYAKLPKIKNQKQFDDIINTMADDTKSPDYAAKALRLGIILNISDESFDNIDSQFQIIKDRFAPNPDEVFIHIQNESDMDEFIAVIAAGNEIPIDDIRNMGEELSKRQDLKKQSSDRGRFFKEMEDLSAEDSLGDMDLNFRRRRPNTNNNEAAATAAGDLDKLSGY